MHIGTTERQVNLQERYKPEPTIGRSNQAPATGTSDSESATGISKLGSTYNTSGRMDVRCI